MNPEDFLVGVKFTLLKDYAFKKIVEKSEENQKILNKMNDLNLENLSGAPKIIKAKSSKVLFINDSPFEYKVYGPKPQFDTGIYDFLDAVIDINDMSFRKDSFTKHSNKLSTNSSISSLKDTLQTVQSKKHFEFLKSSISNFKIFNYSDHLDSIVLIQKT